MARLRNWQLFALAVAVWGTTWHAIVYQLAHTAPAWGVTLRFALAGALALAWAAARGDTLRLGWRAHRRLALQGAFMYSLAYLCVYHAERHVPSGLVAVGYSASPLAAGVGAWLLWRTPLGPRFVAGGMLGIAGVVLIFRPEFGRLEVGGAALGAMYTVGAVALSTVGSLVAHRNRAAGLAFWPALGWGMTWGAATSLLAVLAGGEPLVLPTAPSWWLSLAYLAAAGSVLAFACFLTLQQRLGPGRASTIGVMTPIVALAVSAEFEGWRPGAAALAGAALAVAGNVLMLRRGAD